jgi:SAM-dependent methyltransferase
MLNFVRDPARAAEREFYDEEDGETTLSPPIVLDDLRWLWTNPYYPPNERVRELVGDIRGKRVLLLGNGASEKELLLVEEEPELMIVSDLAAAGLRGVRRRVDIGPYADRVQWATIDALDLPFADHTLDLVYGYAFAHHLDDLPAFVAEVARVLAPGGRALFFDDAYAPAWQWAKRTVLAPLMAWSHRRRPISPEDERVAREGGFRPEVLTALIEQAGGRPFFERSTLVHYLYTRAAERLAPPNLARRMTGPPVARRLIGLDRRLARVPGFERNLIRLVWGWDAPFEVGNEGERQREPTL